MAEHFTKSTVMASFWCAKCHKATMHHVSDGRRGGCMECIAKPQPAAREPKAQQDNLFSQEERL